VQWLYNNKGRKTIKRVIEPLYGLTLNLIIIILKE
jgi:hypothetical protein